MAMSLIYYFTHREGIEQYDNTASMVINQDRPKPVPLILQFCYCEADTNTLCEPIKAKLLLEKVDNN